jgi:hypothetical protein
MGAPDIERILREKLRLAEQSFETAKNDLREVTSEVPSGLPHPDGTQRIENAGISYRKAIARYSSALDQFSTFIIDGTVPEDLKEQIRMARGQRS